MKRLILIPMLFIINLAFSQKVDCNKLSATNIYFNTKDSMINVTVNYIDISSNIHLNYPGIKSVIDQNDNLDTLSAKIGSVEYYVQLANTEQIYHLKYKKMSDYDNYKIVFVYNDLLGQTGENTCILNETYSDSLICKYVKILNDTVTIDFENNRTDLKFSYQRQAFPYPNFEFISTDPELIIANGFQQTYTMGNDYNGNFECSNNCQTYSAYTFGMDFSTTATETKYLKGKFVIGSLDKSRCYFDIVYKVVPPLKFYPNPFNDVINFEINNLNFVIFNLIGQNVLDGVITDKKINTSSLNDGVYLLSINGKKYKIIKDSSIPTSIDIDKIQDTSIYPNPFENEINVNQNNVLYSVYDIVGNAVLEGTIHNHKINTASLKSGVYILEIEGIKHKVLKK